MATLALSNLFMKFVTMLTLVVPLLLLYQDELEYIEHQTAIIERNKQAFLWVMLGISSFIIALLNYAKYNKIILENKEKELDIKIKEEELKRLKDENN